MIFSIDWWKVVKIDIKHQKKKPKKSEKWPKNEKQQKHTK